MKNYWKTRTNEQDAEDRTSWIHQCLLKRKNEGKLSITTSTAVRWLKRLGFQWREVRKGIFLDGHEKEDVVDYRTHTFIPEWSRLEKYMPTWDEDGSLIPPRVIELGKRLLIPCTHDECTFHSNDGINSPPVGA